jgi:hypothetical protein
MWFNVVVWFVMLNSIRGGSSRRVAPPAGIDVTLVGQISFRFTLAFASHCTTLTIYDNYQKQSYKYLF